MRLYIARVVQEDVTTGDALPGIGGGVGHPAHVKLMGKGRKERISPIKPPSCERDADLLAWLDSL